MSDLSWYFPSTGHGDEDGISDSLREMFEGDHERYVARESIQNSLDARRDYSEPVRVRFERFSMQTTKMPAVEELKKVLVKASEYYSSEERVTQFYSEALECLEQPTISILKISDFNTVGLDGGDRDVDGRWYKLIRAQGVNSMSGVGGGSFGIGKGAPFAASNLHTVLYSTMTEGGLLAFQGKARLSSFKNDSDDVRRGIGQLGIMNEQEGMLAARDNTLIPETFVRSEVGTDIYILGYKTDEQDWKKHLLNSLLNNFWAAIYFKELEVELVEDGHSDDILVDDSSLEELMLEYANEKDDSYKFYKSVQEPSIVVPGSLDMLGDVSLYIRKEEGYPKAVQLMRSSKMVVDTISNFRVLHEPYAAVFMCDNDEGNRLLRNLEPPAHDKWDPDRDKQNGHAINKELRDFIRNALKSVAENEDLNPEDIPDLSKYLPEIEERDDLNPYLGEFGEASNSSTKLETGHEIGATGEGTHTAPPIVRKREVEIIQSFASGETTDEPPAPGRNKTSGSPGVDTTQEGAIEKVNTTGLQFRTREVKRDGKRMYRANITSPETQTGTIKIVAKGDDADYPVEIAEVRDSAGEALKSNGAYVELHLTENQPLLLYIELAHQRRYTLGVESYGR